MRLNQHTRWIPFSHRMKCLVVMLLLFHSTVVLSAFAAPSRATEQEVLREPSLVPFVEQFLQVYSVHMEAQALIHLKTPAGSRTGQGRFVYDEQDGRFRIRCETDRSLGLMDDIVYIDDGQRSLIWFLGSNTVSANESLGEEAPTALPNPFFLPVDFLVDSKACPQCRVGLERLRRAGLDLLPRIDHQEGSGRFRARGASSDSGHDIRATLTSGMWVPESITRTSTNHFGEVQLSLREFESFGGFVFPRTVTVTAGTPDGRTAMRIDLLISEVEINRPIEAGVFSSVGDQDSTFVFSGIEDKDIAVPPDP